VIDFYLTKMTRKYGLIGYPLTHSFSRKFFTGKFQQENIDAEYLNFEIENIGLLPDVIAKKPELVGLNVTIPYKEQVIPFLDEINDAASKIRAVNTIRIERSSSGTKLIGFNTDVVGFMQSIRPLLKDHHKKALVLGTGGASKAIIFALKELGISALLVSRNSVGEASLSYNDLDPKIMSEYQIIVNTTPLGTFPKTETFPPIPYEFVGKNHLLYDLVYNPEITEFLRKGSENGASIKNGLEMLHLQALAAWEIWNC
jgi:shikimate dehydrogenase